MSYPRKKDSQKESQQRQQSKEEISYQDRVTHLENAIQKLQQQQEQLTPLLELTNNVPGLIKVEGTSKTIAQKYKEIEECIRHYEEQLKEIRTQSEELSNKSIQNSQEETTKREKESQTLINHVNEVQNNIKQLDIENQMEIKNLQVASKMETIQVVENFDNKMQQLKGEYSTQLQELTDKQNTQQEQILQDIHQYSENLKKFKTQSKDQLANINDNLSLKVSNHIKLGQDNLTQFQDQLMQQLEDAIEISVNKEKKEILKKQKNFHLKFSQEMLSLRGDIEKIRDQFEEKFKGELLESVLSQPPDKKLNGLNQEVRRKMDILKLYSGKTFDGIQEILEQVQETLGDLEKGDNNSLEVIQETIQQVRIQIQQCTQTLENQSIKNQSDLYKLQEQQKLVDEIKAQLIRMQVNEPFEKRNLIQRETDLAIAQSYELTNLKKELNLSTEETQKQITNVTEQFNETLQNVEQTLGIKITETKQQKKVFKTVNMYGASNDLDIRKSIDFNEAVIDLKNK